MITEVTPTQDLVASLCNTRNLGDVSYEQGCTMLDAIKLYDSRAEGGKLGTWQRLNRGALAFVPTSSWEADRFTHALVADKLAGDVVAWMARQTAAPGTRLSAWVVIDRATRVAWVECSLVSSQASLHPRALHETGTFPSSSRGTVNATTFLDMGTSWRELLESMLEAYRTAKHFLDGETA